MERRDYLNPDQGTPRMASEIARTDEWRGSVGRRVELAVVMHGTSVARHDAARVLARLVAETGARGAAFGWTDDLCPHLVVPVLSVSRAPNARWSTCAQRTLEVVIESAERRCWRLILSGVDVGHVRERTSAVDFLRGYFYNVRDHDCPTIPTSALTGEIGRFVALLDAYRMVSFSTNPENVEFFRKEFSMAAGGPVELARVVDAIGDRCALCPTLLEAGNALDAHGLSAEAAAFHVVGYEIALLECNGIAGIEAARAAGRAFRKIAAWDESLRWYGVARSIAIYEDELGQLALAMDGMGNTHRERGAHPKARELYSGAWTVAMASGEPAAVGNVAHSMMTAAREAGDLESAARYGWLGLEAQPDAAERVNLLLNVGTLLREGEDLDTAAACFGIVRRTATDAGVRMMAADALAYCAALRRDQIGYAEWRAIASSESRDAAPYFRAQVGYFRGLSLRALGREPDARRVFAAVDRYATATALAEWAVKASQALEASEPPPRSRTIDTPAEVRRGLRGLAEASA
jgi:hypothetical protein